MPRNSGFKGRRKQWRRKQNRRARTTAPSLSMTRLSGSGRPNTIGLGFQHVMRVLTAALPIISGQGSLNILELFNLAFNLYKTVLASTSYYTGAYCMFTLSPGVLVKQSPLLAKDGDDLSFPGHPISIKYISLLLHSTVAAGAYVGKWTAVFVPFIEVHDYDHYSKLISNLTFDEIAAMPYAKSGPTFSDLRLNYQMRDRTAYCARPRELEEPIGLIFIAWDNSARDEPTNKPVNSAFNCEVEIRSGFQPHVIFGPQHRVKYPQTAFTPKCLTDGTKELAIFEDGRRVLGEIDWSSEILTAMAIE